MNAFTGALLSGTGKMLGEAEWAALKERLQSIDRIWKHGHADRNRRFVSAVY